MRWLTGGCRAGTPRARPTDSGAPAAADQQAHEEQTQQRFRWCASAELDTRATGRASAVGEGEALDSRYLDLYTAMGDARTDEDWRRVDRRAAALERDVAKRLHE